MKRFLGCALAILFLSVSAMAADAEQTVPAKVGVLISTKAFGETIKDIEAVAGAAMKGTPFQMYLAPGMLEMQFFTAELRLPAEFVDNTLPVHSLLLVGDEQPGQCYILPVKGLTAKIESLKALGLTIASPEAGAYQATGENGAEFFLVDAGKDQVVYSNTLEDARAVADMLKGWTPQAATNTLRIYVNAAGLYAAFKADADALPQKFAQTMVESDKGGKATELMRAVGSLYGEGLLEAIKGSESVVITADAAAAGVEVRIRQKTVAGTGLAKLAADCASFKSDEMNAKLVGLLPADSFAVITMGMPTPVADLLTAGVKRLAPAVVSGVASPAEKMAVAEQLQLVETWMKLSGNNFALSYGSNSEGSLSCAAVGDIPAGKEAQYQAASVKAIRSAADLMNNLKEPGAKVALKVEEKKVAGVDALNVRVQFELPPEADKIPNARIAIDVINKNYNYVVGCRNSYWLMTMGGQAEADFEALVKRVDGGASVVNPAFFKGISAAADRNLCGKALDLNAFLRQLSGMVKPIIHAANPNAATMINGMIDQFVQGLPADAPLIISAAGARQDGFAGSFSIPVASIKGAVDQGIAIAIALRMQAQMLMKDAAGAAVPNSWGDGTGTEDKEDSE